ncbi:PQQ-dependent sugar dehydrogenase [Alphaproteobacteria bacterium KMM 3653]|uniref:PQQ-dependent sugar dehydrogenase n=1 Tax=Harenicola maris TaxID=2841044 RepID=A0AAP2CM71_9RHOB|nr:PQQ-dependent sugar dehydrogenase [Harenicola maris]
MKIRAIVVALMGFCTPAFGADFRIETVMEGLSAPWAVGFLPGGAALVTERDGRLLHRSNDGAVQEVSGVPRVFAQGQGGLLDVMVPRDFAQSRRIYLSFAAPQAGGGAGTALGIGVLSRDGSRLTDFERVFEMAAGSKGGRHFGSRIVEGADGYIYLTIGERGDRPSAQDLSRENGSVVRLTPEGDIPADNPELGSARAIYSYGHRNPQGAALDGRGNLWVVEHGAAGGDELNRIKAGANYGWPVISYGKHYSGGKIGEGTSKAGMEQPAHYWDPSIAPSGLMIYSGKLWPEWAGDAFVGSLKFDMISRLELSGSSAQEVERIASDETLRVRDIREAPDGSIWFLSVVNDALYRMVPAQ